LFILPSELYVEKELREGLIDAILDVAVRKELKAKTHVSDPAYREAKIREVDRLLSLATLVERWEVTDPHIRAWQFSQLKRRCGAPAFLLERLSEILEGVDTTQKCG
jgi:hypothetical protein